jgi:hypothetical protein
VPAQQTDHQTRSGRTRNPSSVWVGTAELRGVSVSGREADDTAVRHFLRNTAQNEALLPVKSLGAKYSVGICPRGISHVGQ